MKKKLAALLMATGLVAASVIGAQPASAATGSWQPYGSTFTTPSNWYCGSTSDGPAISSQVCLVRSGAYVQTATIVRNRTSSQVIVNVPVQHVQRENGTTIGGGSCAPSGVAPLSVSVCFTPTVVSSGPSRGYATVQSGGWGFGTYSIWA